MVWQLVEPFSINKPALSMFKVIFDVNNSYYEIERGVLC